MADRLKALELALLQAAGRVWQAHAPRFAMGLQQLLRMDSGSPAVGAESQQQAAAVRLQWQECKAALEQCHTGQIQDIFKFELRLLGRMHGSLPVFWQRLQTLARTGAAFVDSCEKMCHQDAAAATDVQVYLQDSVRQFTANLKVLGTWLSDHDACAGQGQGGSVLPSSCRNRLNRSRGVVE